MQYSVLAEIPKTQQERLAFIEFRLLFLGSVNRSDLVHRFGVSESAASRDLALYRKLAPANILYDRSVAVYLPGSAFTPLYHYSSAQVLTALAEGFGDDFVTSPVSWVPCERPSRLSAPSVEILVPVSRALFGGRSLNIRYHSLLSGATYKTIVPLVLVDNGLRWHVRAYDVEQGRFADFVLNRFESVELGGSVDNLDLMRQSDTEWHHSLHIELVPHPGLPYPDTVIFEYGIEQGALHLNIRAALAGYLLRRWNVDCSLDHSLQGPEYLLWLRNASQLTSHLSLIAPGVRDDGRTTTHGDREC